MLLSLFTRKLEEGQRALAASSAYADARLDAVQEIDIQTDGRELRCVRDCTRVGAGVRVGVGFAAFEGDIPWDLTIARARACDEALPPGSGGPLPSPTEIPHNDPPVLSPLPEIVPVGELSTFAEDVRDRVAGCFEVRLRYRATVGWRGVLDSHGTCVVRPLNDSCLSLTLEIRGPDGASTSLLLADGLCGEGSLVARVREQLRGAWRLIEETPARDRGILSLGPVVLAPPVAGLLLHEAFGHPCEVDRASPDHAHKLARLIGSAIGPRELDVWDRPDVPGARGSMRYDDEGVACRPVELLREGRWMNMLHSRATAHLWQVAPTGNARVTSFRYPPQCRMRVLEVRAGGCSRSALLAASEGGVYLDFPHSGHARGSVVRIVAHGFRICRGKVAEPLGALALVGPTLRMLKSIEGIGNDPRSCDSFAGCTRGRQKELPVSAVAPTLRLSAAELVPL